MRCKRALAFFVFLFGVLNYITVLASDIQTMGVVVVDNEAVASVLRARLRGAGAPVFIINNISRGISQGDIIRFSDRAVLIDEQVWQMLRSEEILSRLRGLRIITLRARKSGEVWQSRSNVVRGDTERKGYLLGGEILEIFEEYFGTSPSRGEIVLTFDGNSMALVTTESFLANLRYSRVRRIGPVSRPEIISNPPSGRIFTNNDFFWQVWAVDPSNPSADIRYSLIGTLHEGLVWNPQRHAIEGVPTEGGLRQLTVLATNPANRSDTLVFDLDIRNNSPPQIYSVYPKEVAAGTQVSFKVSVLDFDHTFEEIQVKAEYNNVAGLEFLNDSLLFTWSVPDTIDSAKVSFFLAAKDMANALAIKNFNITVLSPERILKRKAVKFNFPVDTLIQKHTYMWLDTLWTTAGIRILDIAGSDSTTFEAEGGRLLIIPSSVGYHTLVFKVLVEDTEVSVVKNIPVKKNKPPIFKTMLSTHKISQGYPLYYKPYAKDLENDVVAIRHSNFQTTSENNSGNEGTVFKLNTERVGLHFVEFEAKDEFGNASHQLVKYEVVQRDNIKNEVTISNLYSTNWNVSYTSGWWRIGLFSTNPLNFIEGWDFGHIDAPMAYIGVNFLNRLTTKREDDFFFLSAGLNLRNRGPRVIGGGIVVGADVKYSPGENTNWSFEARAQFAAKQIILIVDTTNVTAEELEEIWHNIQVAGGGELNPQTNILELLSQGYPPLRRLLDEYGDRNNVVLHLDASTLYNFGFGFSAGPAVLMEVLVNSEEIYRQHIGAKFKHSLGISRFRVENNLMTGYDPINDTMRVFWGFKIAVKI